MNLPDLQPTCYELLRVKVKSRALCDIRLELIHDIKGPSRWHIVDVWADDELSLKGRWAGTHQRPKNLDYYRWDTPEAALEVWNRGVDLPHSVVNYRPSKEWSDDFAEEVRVAVETIRAACGKS